MGNEQQYGMMLSPLILFEQPCSKLTTPFISSCGVHGADRLPHLGSIVSFVVFFAKESIQKAGKAPITGTVFHQLIYFSTLFDYQTDTARKHPTFRLIKPSHSDIYTANPANIEHILKTNFSIYTKGWYNYNIVRDLFGDGIFAVDGDKWRSQRKLASYEFSTKVLREFSGVVFRTTGAKLAKRIREAASSATVFDMQDLLMKSTLDSIFKVGFGVDLNTLSGSDEFGSRFSKAFDDSNYIVFRRYVDIFWDVKKYFNVGLEAQLKKNIQVLDDFVFQLIRHKRELMKSGTEDKGKEDILSRFILASEKHPEEITNQFLRDIILNFLIAGKDTTANTLTWFFYMMCKHPFVQEKITDEIKHATGLKDSGAELGDFTMSLTEEVIDKMQYLHAALTETLRLYPAVPVDGKCAEEDDVLPDGVKVKKGDGVSYMTYAMGRMTYLWGEDADDFRPERWLKNGHFQPESQFKFVAFNAGPRICLGKEFAYRQMKVLAAILLYFFKFKLGDESTTVTYRVMFTLHMADGLPLLAFPRFLVKRLWRSKITKKKLRFPPVAGTIFHQLLNFKRLHDFQTELCRKYKTFRLLAPLNNQIYTWDPANIEYILKTNFQNYGKGSFNFENTKELFGDGIFAVDGDKWRQQRKLASYEFSRKVLRDFSSEVFKSNAAKLAQMISERVDSKVSMDIQDLFMKSTMDSIFKVGFGVELNSLQGSEEGTRFSKAFDNSSALILHRYVDPFWKIKRFLNIGREAELVDHIKIVNDFVYKLIDAKIEKLSNPANDSVKKADLLSRFLMEMESDPVNMTPKYLRDIVLNFLIAGKDTTGGTLAWFIYLLCKHPQIQEKVACEVQKAIKSNENTDFGMFVNHLTEQALDKMQYLHATLTETLRLFPSVPLDSKVCFSNDTLPDGYDTRKDDVVFYMPYAMGRMKCLWGDDAEMFRPERWIDANGSFQPESPFKFTAFQAGPRICLGKEFAYRQMKIFAATLLNFFTFKLSNETEVINYRTMITLSIENGLHVNASRRQKGGPDAC